MESKKKIRVLIVDDSSLVRESLKTLLDSDGAIEVIGEAHDGNEGIKKALELKPDVITMDLKMPVMGGLEAIEKIMEEIPTSIIVVSTMDVNVIIKALGAGAMDFVLITRQIEEIAKDLIRKIKISSKVKPLRRINVPPVKKAIAARKKTISKIVAIGVSTGGPQALQVLFSHLPSDFPAGILIVQHISNGFTQGLVDWLRATAHVDIRVAKSGDILKSGIALFAPDNYNILVDDTGRISLKEDVGKSVLYVPSIDEMMRSVADSYKENAIGIIMTGMGRDGVEGIRAIKHAGGETIAQDEKSSVIFGMNRVAIEAGCVDKSVPLDKIADEITEMVKSET